LGKKSREKGERQPVPAPPPVADIPAPPGGPWRWRAAIFALAFVAFLPVLTADFVNLDDEPNFLENVQYRGFTFGNVSWMLSTYHKGHEDPVLRRVRDIRAARWCGRSHDLAIVHSTSGSSMSM
jgi:hypothetical protein